MTLWINYEDITEQITADLAEDIGLKLTADQFHSLFTKHYLLLSPEEISAYVPKLLSFMNNHPEPIVWRCDFICSPQSCMISVYIKTPFITLDGAPATITEDFPWNA